MQNQTSYRVLLVGVEINFRDVATVMLEALGHTVIVEPDADDALARLVESFDVVILDMLHVPKGAEPFIRAIRAQADWNHIPVVCMGPKRGSEDLRQRLGDKCLGILDVPFKRERLQSVLDEAVKACRT